MPSPPDARQVRDGMGWAALHSVRVENPWLAEEACRYSNRSTTNAVACGVRDDSELRSNYEKDEKY